MADSMESKLLSEKIGRPIICKLCGGIMVYKGVGEYQCEECGSMDYDDYGKVRNYLERHRGANVASISIATGVPRKVIRDMIKENRFEVIEDRGGYIRCEICGVNISSGRLCWKCEEAYHREVEAKIRAAKKRNISIYGEIARSEQGSKRYTRRQ